jgi:muramoyltetrapeptide carboxypeptidase
MQALHKPRKPSKNGLIAITSPASTPDPYALNEGILYLERLGFRVKIGRSCFQSDTYFAGSAADRAEELHDFFQDPEIDAIFCARGGFGTLSLLPFLDWELISEHPKLFAGFSDTTALQTALYVKSGLPTLYAPLAAVDFGVLPVSSFTENHFWPLFEAGTFEWNIPNAEANEPFDSVSGILLGGNLSVFSKLCGTPYFPVLKNRLLILEDIEESMHKLDGYLQQLWLSGTMNELKALLLGDFSPPEKESYPEIPDLNAVISRIFRHLHIPIVQNIPFGHLFDKISLPNGLKVELSSQNSCCIRSCESLFLK